MAQTEQKQTSSYKQQAYPLAYHTRLLTINDVGAFAALQERMRPNLIKHYHLKPKEAPYLIAHMQAGMHIVGAFHTDGTLAAATILTEPTNPVSQLGEYPVKNIATQLVVFQSFMIDPAHQGNGLSHMLDGKAKELYPYADFMAKIATDNPSSLDSFVGKRNFQIVEEVDSLDVRDNTPYRAVFVFRQSDSPLRPVCSGAAQADVALQSENA
jgi:hypothetical protein